MGLVGLDWVGIGLGSLCGAIICRAQRVGFFQYRAGSGRVMKKKSGSGRVRVG